MHDQPAGECPPPPLHHCLPAIPTQLTRFPGSFLVLRFSRPSWHLALLAHQLLIYTFDNPFKGVVVPALGTGQCIFLDSLEALEALQVRS